MVLYYIHSLKLRGFKMGLGKSLKKGFGKVVNAVTGGNEFLNSVVGLGVGTSLGVDPVTATYAGSNIATSANKEELNKKAKRAAEEEAAAKAAEEFAEYQRKNSEAADYERKILGQRSSRIENAAQSRTDFTSEEDVDPRAARVDRLLAKKRKLIGFE